MDRKKTEPQSEPDELEEAPDRELRTGFTTGTAATAAAMAATRILLGQPAPTRVEVRLPGGEPLTVTIRESSIINADEALAIVIKDAGDDPDVTNKTEIGAIVRRRSEPGLLHIIGGRGVGRVTKPGLAVPPGQWAINPGPRQMLNDNLKGLMKPGLMPGIEVEVFVEKGEELAPQTLNPRLGIVDGISILGTTGLVKPFSNQAYLDTIASSLDVARAMGLTEIILTTGRQSEKLGRVARPDLPAECFVQIADFFGDSLQMAAGRGFETIGLVSFFGKAVKQAAGHFNTHAHKNDQDPAALADWFEGRIDPKTARELREVLTARGALDIMREAELLPLTNLVADRALGVARDMAGPGPKLWMTIFDYDGQALSMARAPDPDKP